MLKNYLKTAYRNIVKNRLFSAINIFGLTISIVCCLGVLSYVIQELSYDQFHSKKDRIFRVMHSNGDGKIERASTPKPLLPVLKETYHEIEKTVSLGNDPITINNNGIKQYFNDFYWTGAEFFEVFDFEVLQGNPKMALKKVNSLVFTRSSAEKVFGSDWAKQDLVGKTVEIKIYDGDQKLPMQITAIMEDLPENSHLQFEILGSLSTTKNVYPQFEEMWSLDWLHSYVLLKENTSVKSIEAQTPNLVLQLFGEDAPSRFKLVFQPMSDIHLKSRYQDKLHVQGDIQKVYAFSGLAIFVLIIACANFMNLSTAQSIKRAKEVGVRKTLGALRHQLVIQFFGESLMITFISVLLSVFTISLFLNLINGITDLNLSLNFFDNLNYIFGVLSLFILVGILSGTYPAIVLSGFTPQRTIKGQTISLKTRGINLRKTLVAFQLVISFGLIATTLIVRDQIDFIQSKDLGFNKSQLLVIDVEDKGMQTHLEGLKKRIEEHSAIERVAVSSEKLPSEMNNTGGLEWRGQTEEEKLQSFARFVAIDDDYFPILETRFLEGSNLKEDYSENGERKFILNQTAASKLPKEESIIGSRIRVGDFEGTVEGVVEDVYFTSLHHNMIPVAYFIIPGGRRSSPDNLIVKLNSENAREALAHIETVWDSYKPDKSLSYEFVDAAFAKLYRADQQFLSVFTYFSIFSITIAMLGLFGLMVFSSQQRTKEIGVRKILGASVLSLLGLFTKEFAILLLIAFVISGPIAYFCMEYWLEGFAYRVTIEFRHFMWAGILATIITYLTIGFQSLKTALANPVNALKSE